MIELKNNPAGNFFLLAGPCVIEGEEMAMRIAERIVTITEKQQRINATIHKPRNRCFILL
jgi:2-dehydro-3-deoxyphosphooctonate aldolase (KDO 8-P synthase)